jgi:uncharacterized protein (DUF2384 family)
METLRHPTSAEQLTSELHHPSASVIWDRALEVFGDEEKARHWMNSPRDIFDDRSPQELVHPPVNPFYYRSWPSALLVA